MPAPKASKIGRYNRRVTFYNTDGYTQDAGSGSRPVETERWQQWAEIKDGTAQRSFAQSQYLTIYDLLVKVRFDRRFTSRTWMIYEGQVCECKSMDVNNENYKSELVLQYSKTDTWLDLS